MKGKFIEYIAYFSVLVPAVAACTESNWLAVGALALAGFWCWAYHHMSKICDASIESHKRTVDEWEKSQAALTRAITALHSTLK
jgi:hypothetical protein